MNYYRSYDDFNLGSRYSASAGAGIENAIGGILLVFVIGIYLILLAYLIVNYVIRAIGLYRIAKNNSVDNAWLAWVPLADLFLLSKITGDVTLGKRTLKHTGLWLILVPVVGGVVALGFYFGLIVTGVVLGFAAASSAMGAMVLPTLIFIMLFACFLLVLIVAELLFAVIYGMTYYKLCTKYKENVHSVFYTLLALFVPLADAILMCKMSKMMPIDAPAETAVYENYDNNMIEGE